jgi:hypothetical protein
MPDLRRRPPNGFASAQNSREYCALQFEQLPETSRFDVPQKRAKLTSTSGLFRRQSAQNSKLTVLDCNQNNWNRRSQRGGAAIKTGITTESWRHGAE